MARIAGGIERVALTKRVVEHGLEDARQRLAEHNAQLQEFGVNKENTSLAAQRLKQQSNDLKAQNHALAEIQKGINLPAHTRAA